MSNMVKAVSIICVTALIMFVLYFTVFSEQKQWQIIMESMQLKTVWD